MTSVWDAEIEFDVANAQRLIESQFPELAPARVELLGEGWDNFVFRVNASWVFRFPRRAMAAPLIATEAQALAALAPRLPLPIPVPRYFGQPQGEYPWRFLGYPFVPGTTAARAGMTLAARADAVAPIARFLAALHRIPLSFANDIGLTTDTIARMDSGRRLAMTRQRYQALRAAGHLWHADNLMLELESSSPYLAQENVIAHGDVHAEQIMVDASGRVVAVIDWGDVHIGDAATDLCVAHAFFPPSLHGRFREHYGAIDAEAWRAARIRAIWHSIAGAAAALERGDALGLKETLLALDFLVEGAS